VDIFGTCLKSNGLKVIGLHRTTTKKYHLLRDGITQQRETEEFYDLQLTKGPSTSSIFSLPYRRSTKARANSIAVSGPRLVTAFRFSTTLKFTGITSAVNFSTNDG